MLPSASSLLRAFPVYVHSSEMVTTRMAFGREFSTCVGFKREFATNHREFMKIEFPIHS